MPWYHYKRNGWEIAVDAVSRVDANECIKRNAFGAEFKGEWTPGTSWTTETAMTTEKRQEQISSNVRRTA